MASEKSTNYLGCTISNKLRLITSNGKLVTVQDHMTLARTQLHVGPLLPPKHGEDGHFLKTSWETGTTCQQTLQTQINMRSLSLEC